MKKLTTLSVLIFLGLGLNSAMACDLHGKTGIVPKNNLKIKVNHFNKFQKRTGLTELEFHQAIDKVTSVYKEIVASKGARLVVKKDWEDGTVNAFAKKDKDNWVITLYGGFARHEAITKDAISLLVCHELGHHMGGAPVKRNFLGFKQWATNEGQADYWANLKCLRRVFSKEDNIKALSGKRIPSLVQDKCRDSFNNEQEAALCMRTAMAGKSISNVFSNLRQLEKEISFSTPSTKIVKRTSKKHPMPQCRLDTYFSASLCAESIDQEVSYEDQKAGVCSRLIQRNDLGTRPLCWFKPKKK